MGMPSRPTTPGLFNLTGSVELHSEAPSARHLELARSVGLTDVVIKWPGGADSAPAAAFATALSPGGPRFWGGVVLDRPVGGLNCAAVETSCAQGGKFVWLPVVDALNHRRRNELDESGAIALLDAKGDLVREAVEVIQLVARLGVVLGTGHISQQEAERVVNIAQDAGVRHVIVNHPLLLGYTVDAVKQIAAPPSVIVEHCYVPNHPKPFNVDLIRQAVEAVAEDQSVIADFGEFGTDPNIADALLAHGMPEGVIRRLTITTPRRLLDNA